MRRWRDRSRSLTSRLVLTAVASALLVSLLLGTATTLVMRHALTERLDQDVRAALARTLEAPPDGGPGSPSGPPSGDSPVDLRNQAPGTLIAVLDDDQDRDDDQDGDGDRGGRADGDGLVVGGGRGERDDLDERAFEALEDLPGEDDRVVQVDLPGQGAYRVASTDLGTAVLVVGLPTDGVDEAVGQLVAAEVGLGLLVVAMAGGAAGAVVRRQLRPLREVAATADRVSALRLDSGEIALTERVPDGLTDERTEVGQVGAALNALLDHVETSLSARQRSEEQVRSFVADASHELRTPLTTIVGYAELAHRRPDDPIAQRTALAKVTEESSRMTSLVEDLLLLARLDAGRPLEQRPVDLTRLLLEAVSDARVLAPDHRWRLDLPDESVEVLGDEQRLHQVVTNLLINARRHTPPGTTVTVTARPGRIEVHDDGPGFAPDLLPRAFDRFARGDDSRHRVESSTGLGLSLVRAITAAHGGTVELTSVPGDTRVVVHLPTTP